jgi:hypothetical protein
MHDSARWRAGVVAVAAVLLLGGTTGQSSAQVTGAPDLIGQWTAPFEEGGTGTPLCRSDPDGPEGFVTCKPAATATAVLPDGRVYYHNNLEGFENQKGWSMASMPPSSREDKARVLDLRSGRPEWIVPTPERGGRDNPNIKPGHKSEDDPLGYAGVPGRPGDGLVGSTWGQAGLPPHDPTSSPDDPAKNDGNFFCADLTLLPDGRVLIAGGLDWYDEPAVMDRNNGDPADVGLAEFEGTRASTLFDPATNAFTQTVPMKYGRMYHTVAIGADGRPTVFSGITKVAKSSQLSGVRRTETFHVESNRWEENYVGPESEASLPSEPRMVLTPDGKFFYPGVGQMWVPNGTAADEALFALEQTFDPVTKKWSMGAPAPLGARDTAFVVPLQMKPPYDRMDLLITSGGLGPPPGAYMMTPFTTITSVDKDSNVTHRMTGNLHHPRWAGSGVMLPDGQVLMVAGSDREEVLSPGWDIPVLTPELYDPATGNWTDVAAQSRGRTYHNTATLLPDMRVLLGGHAPPPNSFTFGQHDNGPPFANQDKDPSAEVWSPPYLFRGPRPTISRAQAGISYGERFAIGTPQAGEIDSVALIHLMSPQHSIDPDQRSLALDFTRTGKDTLAVVAPPGGNVAPPGHYYLVVNKKSDKGPIPSVARIVRVGVGSDLAEAIQPFPDDSPAPVGPPANADPDSSMRGQAQKAAGEAAQSGLTALPSSSQHQPASLPVLPMAAISLTAGATLTGRRWLRS